MSTSPLVQNTSGPKHIFVSYSRRDLEWVRQLVTDLEAANLPVWLDVHKLKPGVVWDTEVEAALRSSDILLLILSPNSTASRNVLDEINYALSKNRLVVPVLYGACEVPYRLARLQHIDFTGSYEAALATLIERLHAMAGPTAKDPRQEVDDVESHRAVHSQGPLVAPTAPTARTAPKVAGPVAVAPMWRRPAVVGGAVAVCAVLAAGIWLLAGRSDSPAGVSASTLEAAAPQAPADAMALAEAASPSAIPADAPAAADTQPRPPAATQGASAGAAALPRQAAPRTRPVEQPRVATPTPSVPAERASVTPPRQGTPPARPVEQPRESEARPLTTPRPVEAPRAPELPAAPPNVVTETPPTLAERIPAPPVPDAASAPRPGRTRLPPPAEAVPTPRPEPAPIAPARGARPAEVMRNVPVVTIDESARVRESIALYARGLNQKAASLLVQARPGLSTSDAEALLKNIPPGHTVLFDDITIEVHDTTAAVRMTRRDNPPNAPSLQTNLTLTMIKQGDRWVIERIERVP